MGTNKNPSKPTAVAILETAATLSSNLGCAQIEINRQSIGDAIAAVPPQRGAGRCYPLLTTNQNHNQTIMKRLIILTLLAAASAGVQAQNIISWNENNGGNVPSPSGVAGVVAATNWNNSISGMSLMDNSGAASGVSFTIAGSWGAWSIAASPGQDADGTYNRNLLDGYANASSGAPGAPETITISGIYYPTYDLYVYFSSDTAGRAGIVTDGNSGITYDFSSMGPAAISGTNAVFTQTTDTTGASPTANYAVFSGLTGSSDTITLSIPDGGGLAGFQIVAAGGAGPVLTLQTDTTIAPSTAYVGGSVTLSASFVGTPPITNQWKVDTGSGFVNVPGATNATSVLTNVQTSDSGNYALFASNAAGTQNSTPMPLTVLAAPTTISLDVQFTGSWLGGGDAPAQTGPALIGNAGDVWNQISNPTGGTSPTGLARGTNIALVDVASVGTAVTMDYVADYIFNGSAFGFSNPFIDAGSPVAPLMTGYMGSVSQGFSPDTNRVTLHNLQPGSYDLYLYASGRYDGQGRITVFSANGQTAVCGPNNSTNILIAGTNYVHLTPTVPSNGLLNISMYGTTDNGQGLCNGFQLSGPVTAANLFLSSDTTSDSPTTNYAGRTIVLTAGFGGYPPPALQWKVNKGSGFVDVSASATNASLTLSNVQTSDAGSYALFATNTVGSSNSTPIALVILPAPTADFGVNVNVQFDGTTYTGTRATPQAGPAVIGNGGNFWNPVSNPNPVGSDTNRISGSIPGLLDATGIGTSFNLSYLGDQDYNAGINSPFYGSGSPAENLMQAALRIINGRTGTVSVTGLQPGTYDLYLYSCAGNDTQTTVSRFAANGSYDAAGPNNGNYVLTAEGNYVHLTPIVGASGVLTITLTGLGTPDASLNGFQLSGPGATPLPPVAGFIGTPTSAFTTQPVAYSDTSTGNITNWIWSFGDGSSVTNNSGNVTHAYAVAGTYTVSLIANGPEGSSTNTQVGYITVNPSPTFTSATLSDGNLILRGSAGTALAGLQYRILTSANLASPLSSWTPVWTNVFEPDGSFGYTNPSAIGSAGFFRLVSP